MKNPNRKIYLFLFLTVSLTSLYTFLFSFFPFKYFYGISISLMILLTGIVLWKLLEQHIYCFIYFMFNTKYKGYNKLIEKPRLAFHIFILPIMLFTFIQFLNFSNYGSHFFNIEYLIKVLGNEINIAMVELALYLSFFNIGVLLSFLTRTKNFEENFIIKIEEKLNACNEYDFDNKYTETELKNIFRKLIENDFIEIINEDEDILDETLFVKTIKEKKLPENPLFKLKMNNNQYGYFCDLFQENNKTSFSLNQFLKIFLPKSGKTNPEAIRSSKCTNKKNTPGPKKKEIIESLFKS